MADLEEPDVVDCRECGIATLDVGGDICYECWLDEKGIPHVPGYAEPDLESDHG